MDSEKLIQQINSLSKKAREVGLTPQEEQTRAELRKQYLDWFRQGFEQRLENIVLVDPDGGQRHLKRKEKK